ncbi:MAG: BON domain-containing protein [Vicinamibacterales bacterium]
MHALHGSVLRFDTTALTRRLRRTSAAELTVALVVGALAAACSATIDPAAIDDARIAARVKTALVNDPVVGTFTIEVRVVRGVASLSGRVGSRADAERAAGIARAVPGVTDVRPNLQVGGEPSPAPSEPPARQEPPAPEPPEIDTRPGLFAVGGAIGWTIPRVEALKTHVSISPLVKFGSPTGMGPVIGFDWFQAELESVGGSATLTRVNVKPVMAGVGYTLAADRLSITPSIVGGYAFNSLTVTDTGVVRGLPVEVGNSFVWRLGTSAWYDVSRRIAINASIGYVMTGLRLTVLGDERLETHRASGDTAIVHVGLAYRLF